MSRRQPCKVGRNSAGAARLGTAPLKCRRPRLSGPLPECYKRIMEKTATALSPAEFRRHLFYETSHSPSVAELVGYEKAKEIIDFCFIANPYYPTPAMMRNLQDNFPNLIKSYPSSNPIGSQEHLAAVLHVNPSHLIIGNGASRPRTWRW